jgi:hypothetical protein
MSLNANHSTRTDPHDRLLNSELSDATC